MQQDGSLAAESRNERSVIIITFQMVMGNPLKCNIYMCVYIYYLIGNMEHYLHMWVSPPTPTVDIEGCRLPYPRTIKNAWRSWWQFYQQTKVVNSGHLTVPNSKWMWTKTGILATDELLCSQAVWAYQRMTAPLVPAGHEHDEVFAGQLR